MNSLTIVESAFEGAGYQNGWLVTQPKLVILVDGHINLSEATVRISGIPGTYRVQDFTHVNLTPVGVVSLSGPRPYTVFAINRPPHQYVPLQPDGVNITMLKGRSLAFGRADVVGSFFGFGGRVPMTGYRHNWGTSKMLMSSGSAVSGNQGRIRA